jgi:hypothetical protein
MERAYEVLQVELPWLGTMEREKKPQRLPTVLTVREVNEVLGKLEGTIGLTVRLLYGVAPQLTVVTLPLPLLVAVSAWVDVLGAWVRSKGAGGP